MPRGSSSSSGSGSESDSEEHRKTTKVPKLQENNYDEWETSVRDAFYSNGWLALYTASKASKGSSDGKAKASDKVRQKPWGAITGSLPWNLNSVARNLSAQGVQCLIKTC